MKKIAIMAVMAFALAFTAGVQAQEKKATKNEDSYRLLDLFGDVFERVRADYVEEVTDKELIEAAISGMLSSLDPHSRFLNADAYKDMQVQTRGKFGGLGIEVSMEGGFVKVVSPIDDTPAHRAGIQPGDLITHLDGKPVLGLNLSQAVDLMRGEVGTDIKLTIRREGTDPFDVTITRATIPIRSVRSRTIDNVGYVRISSFTANTESGLKKAMSNIKKELGDKFEGVVLDLRNNPGGLLDQAIAVSDAFLDQGEIVSTRTREKGEHQRSQAKKGDLTGGKPMVVLVNGGSASASEIVAGALQDHKRAIVLGTKTFGKGSVQTIIRLGRDGAMRLTTALYYTPSGRSIQKVGVQPDIIVEQSRVEAIQSRRRSRESDLRGALQNGNGGSSNSNAAPKTGDAPKSSAQQTQAERDKADYQLQRALDLLHGIDLFNQRLKG